jgi:hypothetical protein
MNLGRNLRHVSREAFLFDISTTDQTIFCLGNTPSAIQCKTPQQIFQTNNNNKIFNTDFLFHGQAYNEIPFITAGGAGAREVCQTTRAASCWLDS